ncbi:Pr6Pr family membrane protein [Pseudomonas gingeri]|uniref:Pr6Pr family membrane protein n=1 Tax=Pseudomonas gingeri TaxID=117681 RepID=A0A7Y7XDZ4_9PSED|nr:Pr6Pr family membrane protein [Pseudomonas gingeri]NWB98092.1 Pr6Pr family membrane protein [Pseudomonas gingeri]NWD70841.1 Pr6Pr family membrane protein [Pseudomonas gingeri]NWD72947.1 Pr6Pr family membrane protein [Pseudomonas gingeri]
MSDDRGWTSGWTGIALKGAALLGWVTLCIQLYQNCQDAGSLLGGLDVFFSYLTVLCNILVALVLSCAATSGDSAARRFFLRPSVQGGAAVSVVLVALVYNLLLRDSWSSEEFQWVPDELMHDVMPVLFLLYWWFCVTRGRLLWRDVLPWLICLLAYCAYLLLRGYLIGAYPYDFIDVNTLGYPQMFINAAMVVLGFTLLSLLVVAVDRWRGKR